MELQSKDIRFRIDQRFAESDSEEEEEERTTDKGQLWESLKMYTGSCWSCVEYRMPYSEGARWNWCSELFQLYGYARFQGFIELFEIGFRCPFQPYRWMVHVSPPSVCCFWSNYISKCIYKVEMTKSAMQAQEKKCIWKSRSVDLLSWWFCLFVSCFFCWLLVFSQIQEMNWWPRKRPATCKSWRKSLALNHESEKEICTSE